MSEQRQPRVLHIGKYLPPVPGGIETYLGDLLRVSMRHGLEVGAVVHGKKGYPDPNPADFGGAKIYTVPTHGQVLYAPVAPMFPWRLRRAIKEFKPDILHMHVPNTSAFWALFISEARKIPWVLHWHADINFDGLPKILHVSYRLYSVFEDKLIEKAKSIITTSRSYMEASQPLSKYIEKCTVVPLAIDLERLPEPADEDIARASNRWPQTNETRFLAVGRLTFYKGYESLIKDFANISYGSLVIVGDGDLKEALRHRVDSLGLSGRVVLVGELSAHDLRSFFAAADVLCISSVNRGEAFGLTLLEAARYNCRILAGYIHGSGVAEVVATLGDHHRILATSAESYDASLRQCSERRQQKRDRGAKNLLPASYVFSENSIKKFFEIYDP